MTNQIWFFLLIFLAAPVITWLQVRSVKRRLAAADPSEKYVTLTNGRVMDRTVLEKQLKFAPLFVAGSTILMLILGLYFFDQIADISAKIPR